MDLSGFFPGVLGSVLLERQACGFPSFQLGFIESLTKSHAVLSDAFDEFILTVMELLAHFLRKCLNGTNHRGNQQSQCIINFHKRIFSFLPILDSIGANSLFGQQTNILRQLTF